MTPPPVQSFVDAAREFVRRAISAELDGSDTSLAFVDHYLDKTRTPDLKDEVLALIAPALGAYFGEVAIARFGGRWVIAPGSEPARWRVELEPAELGFFPIGMAAEALAQGELEGYDGSFSTKPEWMEPLAEALAASPPVDEAYYYSLTGRLETLEHALQVLVELARRDREDEEDEPTRP